MVITKTSIVSGEKNSMDIDVTEEQLLNWSSGTLIQNAMPDLSAQEREFLITGMSIAEQDNYYDNEEE